MRLFRYTSSATGGAPRLAVAPPAGAPFDLAGAWPSVAGGPGWPGCPATAVALIEAGPEVWARVESVASAGPASAAVDVAAPGFRWLCPLERLASLRDFLAFEDHVRRGAERRGTPVPPYWYDAPVYYKGNHRQVIGPDDVCPWPRYAGRLDFELELAMVVGRGGRDIATGGAGGHVFGFCAFNDFSARDVQAREMAAWLGPAKGKDFCNGLGPCIVTATEVGAEPDLAMACRVNGEEWGRARSSQARWRWADMVAHVSQSEDVFPCDVYGSGTPGGCCGLDLGRELQPGDVVELEIECIGVLRNTIGPRPA